MYTRSATLLDSDSKQTNGTDKWSKAVTGFVKSSSLFYGNSSDVLVEVTCELSGKCDFDMLAFKGIAARSYARALRVTPSMAADLEKVLKASAKGAAAACDVKDGDVACKASWNGGSASDSSARVSKEGTLSETFSALEVIQGLLYKNAPASKTGSGNNATQSGTAVPPQQSGNSAGSMTVSLSAVLAVAMLVAFN